MLTDEEADYWGRAAEWRLDEAWTLIVERNGFWEKLAELGISEGSALILEDSYRDNARERFQEELVRFNGYLSASLDRYPPAHWIELCDKAGIKVQPNLREAVARYSEIAQPREPRKDYETPLLRVQREAIARFFHPRHTHDPKREEVVEWLIDKMRKEGIPVSKNVAEAVFTIIKPPDHDPRKRRG